MHSSSQLRFALIAASCALFAAAASAGDYTVQIGAFRDAPEDFALAAETVGDVRTSSTTEGLTRFRVGSYDSEDAAENARLALVGAGYGDAFVIRSRLARVDQRPSSVARATGDPLAGVPASLRSRVVLLDGAYHVKDGDTFTPLAEALAAEP